MGRDAKLIHDNEQDRAACREWWAAASVEEKCRVWDAIQRTYDDPVMEIVSRFAQLAFGEMVEQDGLTAATDADTL